MSQDYIPDSANNLLAWTTNAASEMSTITLGSVPGLTPSKNTAIVAALNGLRDKAQAAVDARKAVRAADAALAQERITSVPFLHDAFGDLKRMEGITPEKIAALDITSHRDGFDATTYKPVLTGRAHTGFVELSSKKRGAQAMNYFMRRKGSVKWTLVAGNRTKSPVRDDAPLAPSDVPESREYRCIGVVDDQEIGQPSDIVELLFGG